MNMSKHGHLKVLLKGNQKTSINEKFNLPVQVGNFTNSLLFLGQVFPAHQPGGFNEKSLGKAQNVLCLCSPTPNWGRFPCCKAIQPSPSFHFASLWVQ